MKVPKFLVAASTLLFVVVMAGSLVGQDVSVGERQDGKRLFERETFGGNGRTCATCHGAATGTVSPQDAQARFAANPADPLFLADGSDDGNGNGVARMLADATILVHIEMAPNVRLADNPAARTVTLRRGIASTLNTPALDPVLMVDGRRSSLELQALGAIQDHAQPTVMPTAKELLRLREIQLTDAFFSSPALRDLARGGTDPGLPPGVTPSEQRGRRFFEDVVDFEDLKHGLCGTCHSGPMLNETNQMFFFIAGVPPHTRFQSVLVSELNAAHNPVRDFIFTNPDNTETHVISPDPGRALITGIGQESGLFDNVNAFKISPLRGVRHTAPYFHDNSAKTLEAVAAHYQLFFFIVTDLDGPGPNPPLVVLTEQDLADMVAYMKLL
jgi:cytochrome c peroxidase